MAKTGGRDSAMLHHRAVRQIGVTESDEEPHYGTGAVMANHLYSYIIATSADRLV
jgi:hypothetical protein